MTWRLTLECGLQSIRDSASKAGTNITKLADNMSSWWANLDPVQHALPSSEDHGRQSSSAQVLSLPNHIPDTLTTRYMTRC